MKMTIKWNTTMRSLVKKRWYWPALLRVKIRAHFTNKCVGTMDALHGDLEKVPIHVFDMKKEDGFMMLMSTYRTNERGSKKNS